MMKTKKFSILVLIAFAFSFAGVASAVEPAVPRLDGKLSPEKEQRIRELQGVDIQTAFVSLKSPEFFADEDYFNKAVYLAFRDRTGETVNSALQYVRSTQAQANPEGLRNLYLARRVFQVFPNAALDILLDIYTSGGPKVRKNVIYVLGQMAGGDVIRLLLIEALDDDTFCEDRLSETVGVPLRICDVAYNQLVVRYNVKGALRTIGTVHSLEAREYHIEKLKDLLSRHLDL